MDSIVNPACLQDFVNPEKGFFLFKEFLTLQQVDTYRKECESLFHTVPRVEKWPGYGEDRVNRDDMHDYVNPKLDDENGQVAYWRLFQFMHNAHSPETEKIFVTALTLRNHIVKHWLYDLEYKKTKESLGDYVQATNHVVDGRGLTKHTDFKGTLSFPLLQCVVLLSRPDHDFLGGELLVYTKSGRCVRVHSELKMEKGDALFFDKSLFHEVEPTYHVAPNTVGRWTVIIGARYGLPPKQDSFFRRVMQKPIRMFKTLLAKKFLEKGMPLR
jgi:hypothetical protein